MGVLNNVEKTTKKYKKPMIPGCGGWRKRPLLSNRANPPALLPLQEYSEYSMRCNKDHLSIYTPRYDFIISGLLFNCSTLPS